MVRELSFGLLLLALPGCVAAIGNRGNIAVADSNETDPVSSGNVVVAVTPADGTTFR